MNDRPYGLSTTKENLFVQLMLYWCAAVKTQSKGLVTVGEIGFKGIVC